MALLLVVPHFCILANLLWCVLLVVIGGHFWLLLVVFCIYSCSLRCLLPCQLHKCLIPSLVLHHLCFICGFVLAASLLWMDLVQVCILYLFCIGEFWVICVVIPVPCTRQWQTTAVFCQEQSWVCTIQVEYTKIKRVVCQGCVLSPDLFNLQWNDTTRNRRF